MKTTKKSPKRFIDEKISRVSGSLSSRFVLASKKEIKAWKAFVILMFVAGFSAALIWSAYSNWYLGSSAKEGSLEALARRKATITQSSPSGELPAGTTATILSVTTKENASCKYSGTNVKKSTKFKVSGKKNHRTVLSGLENGKNYSYGVVCKDKKTKKANSSHKINFSIANPGSTPESCTAAGASAGSGKCCSGLSKISGGLVYAPDYTGADSNGCVTLSGIADICSNCGNGNCESWENSCNCSKDCPKPSPPPPPPSDTTPPVISGGQPSGNFQVSASPNWDINSQTATMSVATNENATCRYSTTPGVSYDSMSSAFSTTGATNHQTNATYTVNQTARFYVRCKDASGNADSSDYAISFCGYADILGVGPGCSN